MAQGGQGSRDNPVRLDPFTQIKSVNWGKGKMLFTIKCPDIFNWELIDPRENQDPPIIIDQTQKPIQELYDASYWGGPFSWVWVYNPDLGHNAVPVDPAARVPQGGYRETHQHPDWPFGDHGHPEGGVFNPYYPTEGPEKFASYNEFYDYYIARIDSFGEGNRHITLEASASYNAGPVGEWNAYQWPFEFHQSYATVKGFRIQVQTVLDFTKAKAEDVLTFTWHNLTTPHPHADKYAGQSVELILDFYSAGTEFTRSENGDTITPNTERQSTQTKPPFVYTAPPQVFTITAGGFGATP